MRGEFSWIRHSVEGTHDDRYGRPWSDDITRIDVSSAPRSGTHDFSLSRRRADGRVRLSTATVRDGEGLHVSGEAIEPAALSHLIDRVVESLHDRVLDTGNELIVQAGEPAFAMLTESWLTVDIGQWANHADEFTRITGWTHELLLRGPIKILGGSIGLSTSSVEVLGQLVEAGPLCIDPVLAMGRRVCLIAGIGIGVSMGNPALALACTKALFHDMVVQLAKAMLKRTLVELVAGPKDASITVVQLPLPWTPTVNFYGEDERFLQPSDPHTARTEDRRAATDSIVVPTASRRTPTEVPRAPTESCPRSADRLVTATLNGAAPADRLFAQSEGRTPRMPNRVADDVSGRARTQFSVNATSGSSRRGIDPLEDSERLHRLRLLQDLPASDAPVHAHRVRLDAGVAYPYKIRGKRWAVGLAAAVGQPSATNSVTASISSNRVALRTGAGQTGASISTRSAANIAGAGS